MGRKSHVKITFAHVHGDPSQRASASWVQERKKK
jgi:hypothetical protein